MKGSVSRRKPSIALNVIAVVVAINVAGAAVYVLTRHKAQEAANAGDTPAREGEPTGDVSRALRAAGLAALESGRYEEAVKRFTEAAKSSKASADLPQLMKIAMELRDRSSTVPQPRTTTTTDTVATADPKPAEEPKAVAEEPDDKVEDKTPAVAANNREDKAAKARREREQAARERERERERDKARRAAVAASSRPSKPEPADVDSSPVASSPGTIIVSSTPSGLTVQLDGKILDQTPLRLTAEPGSHEIALLHNSTVVFSRRLNVVSSSVQSLDPDVSAQVALLTPSRAEPQPTMANAQTGTPAASKDPAQAGLTTPKSEDKPADKGATGDTSEKPRQDLDPNALYAIANSSVGLSSVSAEQLADVYFGRSQTLNGRKVEPILRSPSGGAGGAFFRSVLHTTTRSYRESWQKLELAGKATPPPILSNASDVWRAVSSRSGAISFALGSELNGNATNLRPIRISY